MEAHSRKKRVFFRYPTKQKRKLNSILTKRIRGFNKNKQIGKKNNANKISDRIQALLQLYYKCCFQNSTNEDNENSTKG